MDSAGYIAIFRDATRRVAFPAQTLRLYCGFHAGRLILGPHNLGMRRLGHRKWQHGSWQSRVPVSRKLARPRYDHSPHRRSPGLSALRRRWRPLLLASGSLVQVVLVWLMWQTVDAAVAFGTAVLDLWSLELQNLLN